MSDTIPARPGVRRATAWQYRLHRFALAAGVAAAVAAAVLVARHVARHGGVDVVASGYELVPPMLAAIVALLAISFGALRPELGAPARVRATAAAWSLTFLAALVFSWFLIERRVGLDAVIGQPVATPAAVDALLAAHASGARYRVPTGVFLQSFEFQNANNIEVSGYLWQKYAKDIPATVERRVVLPEATGSYDLQEVYRQDLGDAELIGWYFHTTLRQPFDYRHYPLDRQDIWLRLWPPDTTSGVVLTPDFAAYRDTSPVALSGLERDFVYGTWDPSYTVFSYALQDYNTDFGHETRAFAAATPELYFNLGLERDFLSPLINHIPFSLAIASLLFGILILSTNDSGRREASGFSTFEVLIAASGLLFATIVDHNQMRNAIDSQQIAYLEVLPFTLYVFIVLVAVNAVALLHPGYQPFFDYGNNLVPVSIFWPAFFGAVFAVTALTFFA